MDSTREIYERSIEAGKLANCPFCDCDQDGGILLMQTGDHLLWWVECGNCGSEGPKEKEKRRAIKSWNYRKEKNRNEKRWNKRLEDQLKQAVAIIEELRKK